MPIKKGVTAMKRKMALCLVIVLLVSIFIPLNAFASSPIDEIIEYHIDIDVIEDGSANINYHFKWHVLDDDKHGPVDVLFIGIPNKHVDHMKKLSDNIYSIEYADRYNRTSGSYAKVQFDQSYYEGEIFEFDFSIHQSYLYTLNDDDETVTFGFTPGWFQGTPVKDLTVRWNGNYVIESNCDYTDENNMLVWQTSFDENDDGKLSMTIIYNQSRFEELDPDKQAEDEGLGIVVIVAIVIAVIVIVAVLAYLDDGYGGGGGFFVGGGRGGGCACASSCACACACAGGGRAGCSVKDFYTAVDTESLDRAFESAKKKI